MAFWFYIKSKAAAYANKPNVQADLAIWFLFTGY